MLDCGQRIAPTNASSLEHDKLMDSWRVFQFWSPTRVFVRLSPLSDPENSVYKVLKNPAVVGEAPQLAPLTRQSREFWPLGGTWDIFKNFKATAAGTA